MSRSREREGSRAESDTRLACPRCHSGLRSTGVHEFRTGGTTGGWKLIFGEWAELGEDKIPLEMLACPECRYVEFRFARR